jgi:hypothetical protein
MPPQLIAVLVVLAVVAVACSASPSDLTAGSQATDAATPSESGDDRLAPAPDVPDGPIDDALATALARYSTAPTVPDLQAIEAIGASGDPRALWVLSDVIRFAADEATYDTATDAATVLSGLDLRELDDYSWGPLTDHLIAWDLPAFDGYVDVKAAIFTAFEPGWQPFFDAVPSEIDWRLVTWGGVRIDDRPLGDGQPCPRGCIPALDDPPVTPAADGDWYPDDAIVFGVQLGDEAVALPKNLMEVHEMVNATIGGQRVSIPYCTLCGAAQVFLTGEVDTGSDQQVVMRTSGLLRRSNKVMYDLTTGSVFDTFTGEAISGPLLEADVQLPQATVVTSSWADWRRAHPDTTILAMDGGLGRTYSLDPLRGRDDDGPIFPIGDRDDRLGVHEQVLGVILPDGTPLAFPVDQARVAIEDEGSVALEGVEVATDAGGLVASFDGEPIASHQAFWFAWSQFHPDTLLWTP